MIYTACLLKCLMNTISSLLKLFDIDDLAAGDGKIR